VLLFFVSGATGLAYEIIWFRRFSHIWGASTLAMGAVVSSFLLGLGIGAHLLGRRADAMRSPLRGYGWCEAGIGLLALLIPFECSALGAVTGALYPMLHGIPVLYTLVRCLLTFLVIGPPCILMGGTFPLLVRQFVSGEVGPTAGLLYAVNTVGAALGCYLAGFHLLPWLGLSGTNTLAAGLNLAVALSAVLLARQLEAAPALPPDPPPAATSSWTPSPGALSGAAALTGLAALLLQMVWTRQLCVMLGGSTYALTSTLFVILLGIGIGSLLFRLTIARITDPAAAAGWAIGLLILSTGVSRLLVPTLTIAVGFSNQLRSLALGNAVVCVAASAALELLPSIGMGFVFPLLVHLTRSGAGSAGRAVGSVYGWNTAGSIFGASATAPVGLALLGGPLTMAAGLACYFVSALLLLPLSGRRAIAVVAGVSLLSIGGITLSAKKFDPRITDQGMFMYGYRDPERRNVIYFKEGASCNVTVSEHFVDRALAVNGKVDATSEGDMDMQLGIAYLPRFLRPDAKNVLVIGYGSGTTSGASLLFPGTRVTCCEIEPAVYGASEFFSPQNHDPGSNPGFSIVFDDGRSHLQGSPEHFDLILSEPSNPWLAGVASLFTREFYGACRRNLGERGMLAQWIQLYSFSEEEYALVIRTVTESFRHACLLRISASDTVLLASDSPILASRADIDAAQRAVDASPAIRADLEKYLEVSDVRSLLLQRLLLDEAGLKRLASRSKSTALNTDLNLRLEFDAPLRLFTSDLNPESETASIIPESTGSEWLNGMITGWACGRDQIPALRSLASLLSKSRAPRVAQDVLDQILRIDPDDPAALVDRAISQKEWVDDDVQKLSTRVLARSADEAQRLAQEAVNRSKYALASAILTRVLEVHPGSATGWAALGSALDSQKSWEPAREAWLKAAALDPLNETIRKNRSRFEQRRAEQEK
jgi:spermidine synthase